jgi:hypothetical protein
MTVRQGANAVLVGLLAIACGDKGAGDSGAQVVTLSIASPDDGAFLDEGRDVLLDVEARDQTGAEVYVTDVAWSADGGWSAAGDEITVSDLPVGEYALRATAVYAGEALSASIDVYVFAAGD